MAMAMALSPPALRHSNLATKHSAAAAAATQVLLRFSSKCKCKCQCTTTISSDAAAAARQDEEVDVVIVGAGLSGLAAARHLHKENIGFRILEASDGVGGRVRTDKFQGFLLDRGFQIFITAYPEAQKLLDYDALQLCNFYAGALVRLNGSFHLVADPVRHFFDGISGVFNPIGTIWDKLLVGLVRLKAAGRPFEELLREEPEVDIETKLQQEGFSPSIVNAFFRPFLGGIFFDRELKTTSRLFTFVFKCLALGENTLPAKGIGEIPNQLARSLPSSCISFNSKVQELLLDGSQAVLLADGRTIKARKGIILAVEAPEASRLLQTPAMVDKPPRSTVCLYFAADRPLVNEPILVLNGSGKGIINNMFFPSVVSPSYAPTGKTLVSLSLIGYFDESSDAELESAVREELSGWFSSGEISEWQHLRTYRIRFAQPDQTPPTNLTKHPRVGPGMYVCGDHRDSATFDGALVSGRRAAEVLLEESLNLGQMKNL